MALLETDTPIKIRAPRKQQPFVEPKPMPVIDRRLDKELPKEAKSLSGLVLRVAVELSRFKLQSFLDPDRPSPMKEWRYAVELVLEYGGLRPRDIGPHLAREFSHINDMRLHARDHFYDTSMKTRAHCKQICEHPDVGIAFTNFECFMATSFKRPYGK